MSHCDKMVDAGRRRFLGGAGFAAAGRGSGNNGAAQVRAAPGAARVITPPTALPISPISNRTNLSPSLIRTQTRQGFCSS